jgi:hypothetical protein
MKKYSNWFYTNTERLEIYTYGLGDHPTKTHRFQNKEDFENKIRILKAGGFEFVRDQSKP